ncbi:hypothetical protein I4U23_012095 [Adineta vaga]|nr:hypothetical protein I4U23_012095 [Adineta vaga]
MGLNATKSSSTNIDYFLRLSSTNNFYRGRSSIHGEFCLKTRRKFRIEKKIHIDLIGQLIQHHRCAQIDENEIFFTYSYPLVTSHENGIARIIRQQQQITYPFRIPLGIHLPPSCNFKEFSIIYYLNIYHDEHLLPNIRKRIILAPPVPHVNIPFPCQITDCHNISITCQLQKSFYSGRNGSIVPLLITIRNVQQHHIQSLTIQLIQTVLLNRIKYEHEIFTTIFNEIDINLQENQIKTILEFNLPSNLSPTHIPNVNCQPDNVPCLAITYEFRITKKMSDINNFDQSLSVPIGID